MKPTICTIFLLLLGTVFSHAQYNFPDCASPWDPDNPQHVQGDQVSYNGINYEAKYWTSSTPGSDGSWQNMGACGDGGLGPDYDGPQRIIGYLPTWVQGYDIANEFNPEVVTHLNVSFLMFKQNNNDYNSSNFASIAFDATQEYKVDSVLFDLGVYEKSKQAGVTVSVALGGATDFAFLWLMDRYYNNDQKLEEIADLILNYLDARGLDGVDLDMECWWADASISGTSDQGGRVRGSKWGDSDQGPHQAAIGLTRLAQKLREKDPDKLLSAAVFGTSWYGNNYDDKLVDYLDWLGLMTYDFTGSWNESPKGPHSSLYKVPLSTYPGQSANNPIYSAQDALEYWMGLAEPAWNHDGGFSVPKSKLAIGVPMYGYDFSQRKPVGNGFTYVPYKDIVNEFPNAPTSYDPLDSRMLLGNVAANGKNIYFNTPKLAGEKLEYSRDYGHQGLIIWELTQDVPFESEGSIMKAINEAAGNTDINKHPNVSWVAPVDTDTIVMETFTPITLQASASDADGTIAGVSFEAAGATLSGALNGNLYEAQFTPQQYGELTLKVTAEDNDQATSSKIIKVYIINEIGNQPPVVSMLSPADGQVIEQSEFSEIRLSASVTDDTSVQNVVLSIDGQLLNVSTAGDEYYALWTPTAEGSYVFKVEATDNEGSTTISEAAFEVRLQTSTCDAPQWDAGTTYASGGNVVQYNGKLYQNKWWTQGEVPGEADVWEFIKNCNGETDPCGEAWQPQKVYAASGTEVVYENKIYRNKWWSQGNVPTAGDPWEYVRDCDMQMLQSSSVEAGDLAYPNPFSDRLNIKINLKQKGDVTLKLINSEGRTVISQYVGGLDPGWYELTLKDSGKVKPGIYLYQVEANGQVIGNKRVIRE
ncbi:Chitinase [Fulvivirga imtechensis AK7]|uniref:chitinase n=1 Tax=Fulvivirga imtechensis AK7 TaxID=1237149 RepID=L8JXZ3_9BACT|nr:glycosyl hydrolase family 18 protein [Fulvivirga imtechensis]ELR73043.1 Chitinase [Fulvivirga imtechensis AK7]